MSTIEFGIGSAPAFEPPPVAFPVRAKVTTQFATPRPRTVMGALAYLGGPLAGLILLLVEDDDRFVRFHAAQSVLVGLVQLAIGSTVGLVAFLLLLMPPLAWALAALLVGTWAAGCVVQWLSLATRAARGSLWRDPIVGDQAWRFTTGQGG